MADASKLAAGHVQDHMPVVGSDGRGVGVVDKVEGDWIKLAEGDPQDGDEGHRYAPLGTVAGLDGGVVRLSMAAAQAREAMGTDAAWR